MRNVQVDVLVTLNATMNISTDNVDRYGEWNGNIHDEFTENEFKGVKGFLEELLAIKKAQYRTKHTDALESDIEELESYVKGFFDIDEA